MSYPIPIKGRWFALAMLLSLSYWHVDAKADGIFASLDPVCLSANCTVLKQQAGLYGKQCHRIPVDDTIKALDQRMAAALEHWRFNIHNFPHGRNTRGETWTRSGNMRTSQRIRIPPVEHGVGDKRWYLNDINSRAIVSNCTFSAADRVRNSFVAPGIACRLMTIFERDGKELKGYCHDCPALRDEMDRDFDLDNPDFDPSALEMQTNAWDVHPPLRNIDAMWNVVRNGPEPLYSQGEMFTRWVYESGDPGVVQQLHADDKQRRALRIDNPAYGGSVSNTGQMADAVHQLTWAFMGFGLVSETRALHEEVPDMLAEALRKSWSALGDHLARERIVQTTLAGLAGIETDRPILTLEYLPEWFELQPQARQAYLDSLTLADKRGLRRDDRTTRWPGEFEVCYHGRLTDRVAGPSAVRGAANAGNPQSAVANLAAARAAAATQPARLPSRHSRQFDAPRIDGRRLDWCLHWGSQCGKPAADAFCRSQGYQASDRSTIAADIGANDPTWVMGDAKTCSEKACDGFASIHCVADQPVKPSAAPAQASGSTSVGSGNAAEQCFERVMQGGIDWGGGKHWNPKNARALCKGATHADKRIRCFEAQIRRGNKWQSAIAACKSS